MNQDVFTGQWKQMRGELKSWWGKLADDDIERIGGQKDKLIGVLQEKYGYAREEAQQEVEWRFKEYADKMSGPNSSGRRDTAAAVAGGPANAPHEGPIATAVAAVAGRGGGGIGARSAIATGVGIGARSDLYSGNSRGGWGGIGELLPTRKKIRRDSNRPHRLDTPVPRPIVIGWDGPWLCPGPTHKGVNHERQVSLACSAEPGERCLAAS